MTDGVVGEFPLDQVRRDTPGVNEVIHFRADERSDAILVRYAAAPARAPSGAAVVSDTTLLSSLDVSACRLLHKSGQHRPERLSLSLCRLDVFRCSKWDRC